MRFLIYIFLLFVPISVLGNGENHELVEDWSDLCEFVPEFNRTWYEKDLEKTDVLESVSAPVMGNGDIVACVGGKANIQSYYMRLSEFWTDDGMEDRNVREIPAGCLKFYPKNPNTGFDTNKCSHEEKLLTAEIVSNIPFNENNLVFNSFVSAVENLLFVEILNTSNKPVTMIVELGTNVFHKINYHSTASIENGTMLLTRETNNNPGVRWISRAGFATKIFSNSNIKYKIDTNTSSCLAELSLNANESFKVLTSLEGGKNVQDHLEKAKYKISLIQENTLPQIRLKHENWWKYNWWLKSYVRTYDRTMDCYYYRSLYLLGTMCREGGLNAGLHGPWKHSDLKSRNAYAYCSNDLGAAVYYIPLISSNRASVSKMWIETASSWVPEARRWAKRECNLSKGIFFPVHWSPWGSVYHSNTWGQKYCASYVSLIGNWYYKYTGDTDYLREKIYPFLRECGDFYEEWLKKLPDGKYHAIDAASYESNDHNKNDSCLELLFADMIFTDLLKYSEILKIDKSKRAKWQDIKNNLVDFPLTKYNGETVFQADEVTKFDFSVNVLQTQIIYPGYRCNRFSNENIRKIGQNTIEQAVQVGSWFQDNMYGQGLYVAALRIGGFDVNMLIDNFKKLLIEHKIINYPNFISKVGLWEFNNQLCLQNYDQGVIFFPDYPANRKASFKHLRAYGAFLCSGEFYDGEVKNIQIFSEQGNIFSFYNPWNTDNINVTNSEGKIVKTKKSNNIISFKTKKGETYYVKNNLSRS